MKPPGIPDHVLLQPIGRGAYGEVWLARNVMGALRAVKIVRREKFSSDRPYEREFAGVQAYEPVARSAEGLVHLLHVGRNDAEGYFYYVLELADPSEEVPSAGEVRAAEAEGHGSHSYSPRTLRSELKRPGRLPTADCIRIALDMVSGLAQLHRHGLVHRDVKPGNVIFVNGRAKLADVGLVAAEGEARTFVGTEGYIAPEGPGSPAADLYALGILLYEASTGLLQERFPDVPPEWIAGEGHAEALELHEVILKACEGSRERRYATAEQMQADLALLQSGQSIRRVRALERRVKLARRGGLAAAIVAVIATAGVLFSGWRARVAEQAHAKESALRTRAEAAEADARERLHGAYLAEARLAVQSQNAGRRFGTLETLRRAGQIRVTPELRRAAFTAMALPDLRHASEPVADSHVSSRAWDSNFGRMAVARGKGAVEIISLADSNVTHVLPPATNLNARSLRFSPDDRYLAFKRDHNSGTDAAMEVWDLTVTQRVFFAVHAVTHESFSFHPKLPRLLMARPDGRIVEWDLARNAQVAEWPLRAERTLAYAPEGGRFALVHDRTVEVRDATNIAVLMRCSFPDSVYQASWHPDGRSLAVACGDSTVHLVNSADGTSRELGRHKAQAVGVLFAPDGQFLVSRGWDREINVWNVWTAQREVMFSQRVSRFDFDPTGRRITVMDLAGWLVTLEFSGTGECRAFPTELPSAVRVACFSPNQRWLAIRTGDDMTVRDLEQPGPPSVAAITEALPMGFSPDSSELFAFFEQRTLRWRVSPGTNGGGPSLERLPVTSFDHLPAPDSPTKSLAVWMRGRSQLQTVLLTNLATGTGIALKGTDRDGALSPDGRWVARRTAGSPTLGISPLTGSESPLALTNASRVRFQVFSPDSASLAVLTDKELTLFDTRTWVAGLRRPADSAAQSHLAYSPDGRLLLCAENTRTASVLDARTLETLLPMPEWTHPIAFSPDGRWLLTTVEARRLQLWDWAAVRAKFRELGIDWEN